MSIAERPPAEIVAPPTLHADLLEKLRDHIVEGNIPDGGRIPERELTELFGVSRTPLREALKVLASEGLIELLPHRGARVRTLGETDIRELMELLGGLESLAGRLACERIDDEGLAEIEALHHEMYAYYLRGEKGPYFRANQLIHEAIVRASGNASLGNAYRSLSGRARRLRFAANAIHGGERWSNAIREHEQILDALRNRDGERLASLLFAHLRAKQTGLVDDVAAHRQPLARAVPDR